MSRIEHHSAFGLLIYYILYVMWTGSLIIPSYYFIAIIFFSIFPDFDAIYYFIKNKGRMKLTMKYQHHLNSLTHLPLIYSPFIIVFIISLITNFYPLYFLISVVGIYCGHFLFDTIASGDGIMWVKNPFKRHSYVRFINIYCGKTDGYHGRYWDARYRQTKICKIGNYAVFIAIIIISFHIWNLYLLRLPRRSLSNLILFFFIMLYFGLKKYPEKWLKEPPEGRYWDYRVNMKYINGLSEKSRREHMEKYQGLLEDKKPK